MRPEAGRFRSQVWAGWLQRLFEGLRPDRMSGKWFKRAESRSVAVSAPMVVMLSSRILSKICGMVFVWALGSSAALADFRLCNNASSRASVAIAYTDGQTWVTEGWWNLKQGACETLLRGPLAAQYYYVYAMDERGGEWKGKAFMCTRDREFRIEGRENCLVRGYDRTGFFEIDTGKDARSWTVQLTDTNQPGQR